MRGKYPEGTFRDRDYADHSGCATVFTQTEWSFILRYFKAQHWEPPVGIPPQHKRYTHTSRRVCHNPQRNNQHALLQRKLSDSVLCVCVCVSVCTVQWSTICKPRPCDGWSADRFLLELGPRVKSATELERIRYRQAGVSLAHWF